MIYEPKTLLEWAQQALLQAKSAPTRAIAGMKLLRGVVFRADRDSINLFTPQNCEAALAYSRGQVMGGVSACKSCKRGSGPFAECVILEDHLRGSCSNCHYNAEGVRCSFRKDKREKSSGNAAKCIASSSSAVNHSMKTSSPQTIHTSNTANNIQSPKGSLSPANARTRQVTMIDVSNTPTKLSRTALEHKWSVRKMRIKAMRKRKLATLYRQVARNFEDIGVFVEQEANELDEKVIEI